MWTAIAAFKASSLGRLVKKPIEKYFVLKLFENMV